MPCRRRFGFGRCLVIFANGRIDLGLSGPVGVNARPQRCRLIRLRQRLLSEGGLTPKMTGIPP